MLSDQEAEEMTEISIRDEFIKLEQAMKVTGKFYTGADAKYAVKDGKVKVNGETELRRGKKLRPGDTFSFEGNDYKITGA